MILIDKERSNRLQEVSIRQKGMRPPLKIANITSDNISYVN